MDDLLTILPSLPYLLVLLVGVLLSLVTLPRHPRVSALALAGYGGLLVYAIASTLFWSFLPDSTFSTLPPWGWTVVSLVEATLGALLFATASAAVFVGRFGRRGDT